MMTANLSTNAHDQPAPQEEPVLDIRDLSHRFGREPALSGINLSVRPGEVVCLLGPSGCGKTTLLRLAAGLEELQEGTISINGKPVANGAGLQVAPEKRNVGLAFQDSALFPHLTVMENVTFGLKSLNAAKRKAHAMQLLEQVGMAKFAGTYPHTLSGGQQQRVALARALAPSPSLMLLDEPFSSLDARLRDQTRDDTLHVLKRVGAGTMLVTHDPEEAMFMADRIALMRAGRIVQTGTPQELYCNPVDPFVVTFFGNVNELTGEVQNGQVTTPVGNVRADHIPDGSRVRVMIRPEALTVANVHPQREHRGSHVIMSKLLGPSSMLHLCAHSASGAETHMHARVPGVFLPGPGAAVDIQLDTSQVFVFPLLQPSAGA